MSQTGIFVVGLIVYIIVLMFIGWLSARAKSKGKGFLTGGNSVGVLPLVGTVVATCIGSGSTMGATGNGYFYGWAGALVAVGNGIGIAAILMYMGMRKRKHATLAKELQFLLGGGKEAHKLITAVLIFVEIMAIGGSINGASKYLCYVTGMKDVLAKLIITVAFFGFSYFGGFLSVVWTDTIQMGIIFVGFILIAIRALPMAGGYGAVKSAFEAAGNADALGFYGIGAYGTMAALTLVVGSFFNAFCSASFYNRVANAASDKVCKQGFLIGAVFDFMFGFLPAIVGMSCFAICTQRGTPLEAADYAFSYMATVALGPVLGLLLLIAGISACVSSADSQLISSTSMFITDLYPEFLHKELPGERYKSVSRIIMLCITLLSFSMALYAKDVIGYITNIFGTMMPGIGVMMILARFWKRITWQGALACVFGGIGFGIIYLFVPPFKAAIAGVFGGPAIVVMIFALILCIVVSLATPACTLTEEERLAKMAE